MRNNRDGGFTLIEILVVISISAILMTLAAAAMRHYWFVNALDSSTDEVVTQLRNAQQRVGAESHPLVYGLRFKPDTADWGVVQYDSRKPTNNECTTETTQKFETGVKIETASFSGAGSPEGMACSRALPGNQFVFFYARGSATGGTVKLTSDLLGRSNVVTVTPITGRVLRP
ncbi:MAG: type II secretion system GspH family protein [Actinomycetota bacterium]|nr:type II secretion system GspH family protein [Actinomycetota bacterium]